MRKLDPISPTLQESADVHHDPTIALRKRLFIGLLSFTTLLVVLLLCLLWYIPYVGLTSFPAAVPVVFGVCIIALIGLVSWSCLGLILHILLGKPVLFSNRLRGVTIKLFLPMMIVVGRLFGIGKERIRNSFIKVNNELVRSENQLYKPSEILLLMPHCLQNSHCDMRLTYDIRNCRMCGKCPLTGLIQLSDTYGVTLAVATGGTIARRIVVQNRPRLILAVACERDLSSGIQDTYPIPVYGVLNARPNGPCLDTVVQLANLEAALNLFLEPEFRHESQT